MTEKKFPARIWAIVDAKWQSMTPDDVSLIGGWSAGESVGKSVDYVRAEKAEKERDEARAAAIERCIAEIGIQKSAVANPGSFMYSVLSSAQSKLRALIDKQAPANG